MVKSFVRINLEMLSVKSQETHEVYLLYYYPVTFLRYKFTLAYYSNYIPGRIEVAGRRGRISKQMLKNLKEKTGYLKLKRKALDRLRCRTGFRIGYGKNHSTL